jgi:hypothetical protein
MTKKENKCANRLEFMRPGPRRITKRRDGSSYRYMQVLEFFRVFSKIENTIVSLIQGGEAREAPPPRVQCFSSDLSRYVGCICVGIKLYGHWAERVRS